MRKKFLIFFIILTFFFISSYNPKSSKNIFINLFKIKNIEIQNNKILSKDDILNEIKPIFGRSLFFLTLMNYLISYPKLILLTLLKLKRSIPQL